MDLSTIRARAQFLANDQNARIATAAQANNLINDALAEWCNETGELRTENWYSLSAGQFMISAPSDAQKILKASYHKGGFIELEPVSEAEWMDAGANDLTAGSGRPSIIKIEGENAAYYFRVFPSVSTASSTSTISDAGGISASDATIGVTDVTQFRSPGTVVLIESEKILVQKISSPSFTQCIRGFGNTTAATHADATAITELDLMVLYSRQPATLSADGDVPEIDARWHKYISYYVVAQILEADGRSPASMMAKWEHVLRRAKSMVRERNARTPSYIIRSMY